MARLAERAPTVGFGHEVVVGLIQQDRQILRKPVEERLDRGCGQIAARRVVGAAQDDQTRALIDRRGHRRQVVASGGIERHADRLSPGGCGQVRIEPERWLRMHQRRSRVQERLTGQEQ